MNTPVLRLVLLSVVAAWNILYGMDQAASNGNANNVHTTPAQVAAQVRPQVPVVEVPAVVGVRAQSGKSSGKDEIFPVYGIAYIVIDDKGEPVVVDFKALEYKEQERICDNAKKFSVDLSFTSGFMLLRDGLVETFCGVIFLIYAGGKWIAPHVIHYTKRAWNYIKEQYATYRAGNDHVAPAQEAIVLEQTVEN